MAYVPQRDGCWVSTQMVAAADANAMPEYYGRVPLSDCGADRDCRGRAITFAREVAIKKCAQDVHMRC
jgi:hypothetical protein